MFEKNQCRLFSSKNYAHIDSGGSTRLSVRSKQHLSKVAGETEEEKPSQ